MNFRFFISLWVKTKIMFGTPDQFQRFDKLCEGKSFNGEGALILPVFEGALMYLSELVSVSYT